MSKYNLLYKKYTAAIIGTGRIGFSLGFDKKREQPASHTMALLTNNSIEIVAGCDTNEENLNNFCKYIKKYNENARFFNNLSDFLDFFTELPDIIVIAVNEDSHLSVTLKVLERRPKLIILEKPVALNTAEGNLIKQKSQEFDVPLLINHERRFALDYNFAREYLSKIGKILTVNARLDSGLRVYLKEKEDKGEYSLLHDGTHLVDIVLFLLDGGVQVSEKHDSLQDIKLISLTRDDEKPEVVRNINVHACNSVCNDINFNISGQSKYFGFEIEIIGSLGRIKIGNGIFDFYKREESSLYTGFYSLVPDKSVKKIKKTGYFANMVQNAVDFLDGKAELKSTLDNGLETLAILEEIKNQIITCGV